MSILYGWEIPVETKTTLWTIMAEENCSSVSFTIKTSSEFPIALTVSVTYGDQRIWAVQSHAPDMGKLRISPVQTLIEKINGQPWSRIEIYFKITEIVTEPSCESGYV